jgi:hypothetical protein
MKFPFKINRIGSRFKSNSHCEKKNESVSITYLEYIISGTRGLSEFSNGNGKKETYVAESPYVLYSQRSLKFSIIVIQRMIDSYSLPHNSFPIST